MGRGVILNTAIPQKIRIPQPRPQGLWERGCKYRDTEKNVGKPRNTSIPSGTRCHTEATTLYRDSIEALNYCAVIFRWFDIAFFSGALPSIFNWPFTNLPLVLSM